MNEHGEAKANGPFSQTGEEGQAKVPAQEPAEVQEQEAPSLDRPVFTWFALPDRARSDVQDLSSEAGNRGASSVAAKPRTVDFTFLAELSRVQQRDPCEPEQGA